MWGEPMLAHKNIGFPRHHTSNGHNVVNNNCRVCFLLTKFYRNAARKRPNVSFSAIPCDRGRRDAVTRFCMAIAGPTLRPHSFPQFPGIPMPKTRQAHHGPNLGDNPQTTPQSRPQNIPRFPTHQATHPRVKPPYNSPGETYGPPHSPHCTIYMRGVAIL
jgi:hypothetical protein